MEMRTRLIQCRKYIGWVVHQFLCLNSGRRFISGDCFERTCDTLLHRCLCVTLTLTHYHLSEANPELYTSKPIIVKVFILRCGDINFRTTGLSTIHEMKGRMRKFYRRLNVRADLRDTLC
jgi:hypothetical protein